MGFNFLAGLGLQMQLEKNHATDLEDAGFILRRLQPVLLSLTK
jgi:hypothetical protein